MQQQMQQHPSKGSHKGQLQPPLYPTGPHQSTTSNTGLNANKKCCIKKCPKGIAKGASGLDTLRCQEHLELHRQRCSVTAKRRKIKVLQGQDRVETLEKQVEELMMENARLQEKIRTLMELHPRRG
jgi:hypothetical protein